MKSLGGTGLVIIGFIFIWMAISGRLDCLFAFFQCVASGNVTSGSGTPAATGTGTTSTPGTSSWFGSFKIPEIPSLPKISF